MSVLRRLPQPVRDWAVPALLAAGTAAEALSADAFAGRRGPAVALAVAFMLAFGLRRRSPLLALAVAWTLCALGSVLVASFFHFQTPLAAFIWSGYLAGSMASLRAALAGLGILLAGLAVVILTYEEALPVDYLFPAGLLLIMWFGSRTLRNRTLLAAELHEAAARADERREAAAAQAMAEERRRIAREMHDLVGHSISVMVVQAGGARRILERDAMRAEEAAARIEETGRAALADMRRLLGLLGPHEADHLAPQPTLAGVEDLVDRARDAGLWVTLEVDGEARSLPAGAEAAAYRVVQEALTNALKHAPGALTEVLLRWTPDALEIVVADRGAVAGVDPAAEAPRLPGGGHGLVGMRERVAIYGGSVSADRRPDGGFTVRARLPVAQEGLVTA